MKKYYSNAEDCYFLASELENIFGKRIDFYGSIYTEVPNGKYLSSYRKNKGEYLFYDNTLKFYFKFSKNEFLRIGVGSSYSNNSLGEKMAALSDFYEVLNEMFGEPIVFYTTKDDKEGLLNLQWSFINKEDEIESFKNGTCFDDAEIDTLIIFEEKEINDGTISLSDRTKDMISKKVGLPFELLPLVDGDIENFIKYKNGKEMTISNDSRIDGLSVKPFERKLK